jgi:hypothetical protein
VGTCAIKVRAENQCGNGAWSAETSCIINHNPVQFDLTGEGGYCEGTDGSELILSGSEAGVDYELYLDSEPTGVVMPGTGSPLNFGYFTEQGIYSATAFTDFCSTFMVGQIFVHELPVPGQAGQPNGPETGCDGQSATYTTIPLPGTNLYTWTLTPEDAGVLTPVFDTAHITWNAGFTGNATLSVHGENSCGEGPESTPLEIDVYLSPTPEITGLQLVCADYEEQYETADNVGSFYSWEVSGGVITDGAGTHQVTVLWGGPGDGSVSVTETNEEGCSATAGTLDVTIEICESVGETPSGNIRIYPNPAGDVINISINNTDIQIERIFITNAAGQLLLEHLVTGGSAIQSMDISDYPAGVYFVKAISKDHVSIFRFHKI